ncbi:response regulator [Alsobacter sp. KACC 23698]|uniref:Response regulator n=1 Tax=Alsobacter sp. KACC 23698 TaxID=3149229 RepID=A0AAU7JGI1_9HYPH
MEPRRKILIVEDEWIIALDLKTSLERRGYDALGPAPNVAEALALIQGEQVDGAILDVKLFDETSFAVADVLQERCIPYVFSTGYNPEELPAKYSEAAVLGKPHDERELLAALRLMFGG